MCAAEQKATFSRAKKAKRMKKTVKNKERMKVITVAKSSHLVVLEANEALIGQRDS